MHLYRVRRKPPFHQRRKIIVLFSGQVIKSMLYNIVTLKYITLLYPDKPGHGPATIAQSHPFTTPNQTKAFSKFKDTRRVYKERLCNGLSIFQIMMTSSNGNILRVTGLLCVWCVCVCVCVWGGGGGELRRHLAHYDFTVMWIHSRLVKTWVPSYTCVKPWDVVFSPCP